MPQVIKKSKIVLVSALKPVDDIRMNGKIGQTLAGSGLFEVHIIGFPVQSPIKNEGIFIHPLPFFKRISLKRLLIPFLVLNHLKKIRPEWVMACTHELLWIAVLYKALYGAKIFYDVQENYFRNILYTHTFPALMRPWIAGWTRVIELLSMPFIQGFILAEKCFETELAFLPRKKTLLLENKTIPFSLPPSVRVPARFIFTGTLSESTGVFRAIEIVKTLHAQVPIARLTLAGYCPEAQTYKKLKGLMEQMPFLHLLGGNRILPHRDIVKEINKSAFGIIAYRVNPAIENKMPTKVFEYLAYQLPMVMTFDQPWKTHCQKNRAGIVIDDTSPLNANAVWENLKRGDFYTHPPENVFWEGEKLISWITNLSN